MNQREILNRIDELNTWSAPEIEEKIPHGDMPGDKVCIEESHIEKATVIFPQLLQELKPVLQSSENGKAVVCVCGGSGVGKSEIASLLSYYFKKAGIGAYTLSGDNYPHRIPRENDAERLRVFRTSGLKQMIVDGVYTPENFEVVQECQAAEKDADYALVNQYSWYQSYLTGGMNGLKGYLGTEREIDFAEIESIVSEFKNGKNEIYLKRMGREPLDLWYEKIDFSKINVLIIEWTHGNSDCYQGVDVPILLNSTPEETLAHRRARNRDGKTDSPFTMRVLEIEQELLKKQAHKARIILSKQGELLDYEQYQALMKN